MTTAIVGGAIANKPFNGGAAWTRLSYVLGLKKLGLTVYFLEQLQPEACVDAMGRPTRFEDSANLAFFRRVVQQFGLADSAALIYSDGERTEGATYDDLVAVARRADFLINISGHLTLDELKRGPRRKLYVDTDPGFTQFWHAQGQPDAHLDGHDVYFTTGENIGTSDCPIPTGGIAWRPTRPPVMLQVWPMVEDGATRGFTTVGTWRGPYGPVQQDGSTFGLKVHEFRKFIELPELTGHTFEIALDIHPADGEDLEALRRHGWRVVDPGQAVPDPASFRRYVQRSAAEFSAAQGIYVETRSGWFSDRTVRYLATGRPALVQDTGFGRTYPAGKGLLSFSSLDEAIAGVEAITRDHEAHRRAARALAERYFDSDKVLGELLDDAGKFP